MTYKADRIAWAAEAIAGFQRGLNVGIPPSNPLRRRTHQRLFPLEAPVVQDMPHDQHIRRRIACAKKPYEGSGEEVNIIGRIRWFAREM